jgi:hypothetical protein
MKHVKINKLLKQFGLDEWARYRWKGGMKDSQF